MIFASLDVVRVRRSTTVPIRLRCNPELVDGSMGGVLAGLEKGGKGTVELVLERVTTFVLHTLW